jgi:hypothetical protein
MDKKTEPFAAAGGASPSEHRHDRKGAAAFLELHGYKVAPATLAKLASTGGGPPFRKFGRKPIYAPSDLLAWAEARCTGPVRSTSEISKAVASPGGDR